MNNEKLWCKTCGFVYFEKPSKLIFCTNIVGADIIRQRYSTKFNLCHNAEWIDPFPTTKTTKLILTIVGAIQESPASWHKLKWHRILSDSSHALWLE